MQYKLCLGIALSVFSLLGCVQYQWVHAYKNTQQYNEDTYQCNLESSKAYPPKFKSVTTRQGYLQTNNCEGKEAHIPDCKRTRYIEPITEIRDVNANNRRILNDQCMQVKGWRWRKVEKE
jgi:hypothetical protein